MVKREVKYFFLHIHPQFYAIYLAVLKEVKNSSFFSVGECFYNVCCTHKHTVLRVYSAVLHYYDFHFKRKIETRQSSLLPIHYLYTVGFIIGKCIIIIIGLLN